MVWALWPAPNTDVSVSDRKLRCVSVEVIVCVAEVFHKYDNQFCLYLKHSPRLQSGSAGRVDNDKAAGGRTRLSGALPAAHTPPLLQGRRADKGKSWRIDAPGAAVAAEHAADTAGPWKPRPARTASEI